MITLYQISRWGYGDTEFHLRSKDFDRLTEHFAIKGKTREALKGSDPWFQTREEAVEYRRKRIEACLKTAQDELDRASQQLARFDREHPRRKEE